jgi:hypothetical protein
MVDAAVAVVVEVLQENGDLFVGRVAHEAVVERHRVLEAAREVRDDVGVLGVVIDDAQLRRLQALEVELGAGVGR